MPTEGQVVTEDQPQVNESSIEAAVAMVDEPISLPPASQQPALPAEVSQPAKLPEMPKVDALPEAGDVRAQAVTEPAMADNPVASEAASEESSVDLLLTTEAGVPLWPFVGYDIVWAAFAGVLAWRLSALPADADLYSAPAYPVSIVIGVALAVAGPLVAIYAWRKSRPAEEGSRAGLFSSSLLLGAMATLLGVVLWWAGLSVGDYLRLSSVL